MPTTIKDLMPASAAEPKAATQNPRRTDAVGVEIPVVVHASRNSVAVREIAKPQPPVHEETRTVIVFPQGAVVRLTASMTAGELVVLTNQRSGADVLCRVVSVKAQPGIQNYVDLEFTQRAPGFWGDCFPSEQPVAIRAADMPRPQEGDFVARPPNNSAPQQAPPLMTIPEAPAAPPVSVAPVTPLMPPPVSVVPPVPQALPVVVPIAEPATRPAAQAVFSSLPASRPEPEPPAEMRKVAAVPIAALGAVGEGFMIAEERRHTPAQSFGSSAAGGEVEPGSRNIILIAVAAAVLLILLGSGIVMLRKAPGGSAAITQSVPAQPAAASQQRLSVAPQQAAPVAPAQQAPAPAARVDVSPSLHAPESGVTKPAEESPKSVQLPKAPSRNAVALVVGKLSAPVTKKPAIASSSEPPPVLPASASASAAGTNLLLSSEQNSGPVSPATVARNTTLVGGRVLDPKLLSSSAPTYPAQAALQRVQGDVVVDALVDTKGRVTDAKAISGSPLLQQAAVNAVRTWKYEPARLDGEPVPAHMQVRISFHLP